MRSRGGAGLILGLGLGVVSWSSCYRAELDLAPLAGDTAGAGGELAIAYEPPVLTGDPRAADDLPWLGRRCQNAADCGKIGLRCLTADAGVVTGTGTPPGGLCTADCQTDAECRPFAAHALCANLAEPPLAKEHAVSPVPRLCVLGCVVGMEAGPAKCHGRAELACRPFAPEAAAPCGDGQPKCATDQLCFRGFCRATGCGPRCNSDQDCSAPRQCSPLTGLCDSAAPKAAALGVACDVDPDACGASICADVYQGADVVEHICTRSCSMGVACAAGEGACVWPRLEGAASGDAGYCKPLCDCDSDCRHLQERCLPWSRFGLEPQRERRGLCEYALPGDVSLSCGAGPPP